VIPCLKRQERPDSTVRSSLDEPADSGGGGIKREQAAREGGRGRLVFQGPMWKKGGYVGGGDGDDGDISGIFLIWAYLNRMSASRTRGGRNHLAIKGRELGGEGVA